MCRLEARAALKQAVADAKKTLAAARGTDSRKTLMLKDSIRRVTNQLHKAQYALDNCLVMEGKGERPEVLAQSTDRKAWHEVMSDVVRVYE